ncbi:MAG: helix-turn-helix domain-containing protein [Reyranellaceae bacterium]|jgi:AcrR family transcriptional regulator
MPRPADPSLPFRILAAAYGLWSEGGEDEVTIRNVARRAATSTPTVYAHFVDRAAIMRGVRKLARGRFEAALDKATSMLDGCARVLDFAVAFPRDYELLFGYGYRERADPDRQVAEFAAFEGHIRQAGVREPDVRPTALAIASLLHGTAMFQLSQKAPDERWQEFRSATLDACATLLAAKSVGPAKPTRSRTR